jgi:hypothetical protein
MPKTAPYQPLVFRLLHNISGLLGVGAIITGFWVYNIYDRRFGSLPLPTISDSQGIHGTFGLFFLLIFSPLSIYSLYWGHRRLVQTDWSKQLTRQMGTPIWWMTLQRLANTLMLLAATFTVITGRMMKEAWLPAGELYHLAYSLHLVAWAVFLGSLLLHILMSIKVGGIPLILSMISLHYRAEDSPTLWTGQIKTLFDRLRS